MCDSFAYFSQIGITAMYVGDMNQDKNTDLLDMASLGTDITAYQYGYFSADLNGDGKVDLLNVFLLETNIASHIFSANPKR